MPVAFPSPLVLVTNQLSEWAKCPPSPSMLTGVLAGEDLVQVHFPFNCRVTVIGYIEKELGRGNS